MQEQVFLHYLGNSRQVRLTLKPEVGMVEISVLLGMDDLGYISINPGDKIVLMVVKEYRSWSGLNNRTVTVNLLKGFDKSWFAKWLAEALEEIKAVD